MTKSNRLIFFGNEQLCTGFRPQNAPVLQRLIDNEYTVVAVVAHATPIHSRKQPELGVARIAKVHDIPLLLPEKLHDIKDTIIKLEPNIGVLVAYGKIIPQSIIDLFPKGIINLHPSLLPKYRGSTPIEQAILDGAPETGVSLMKLVKKMDAGPLIAQQKIPLSGTEEKIVLTNDLLALGSDLLITHLPKVINGTATETIQDESKATYTSLITKSEGILDMKQSAETLMRKIRAYAQWPQARISIVLPTIKTILTINEAIIAPGIVVTPGKLVAEDNHLFIGTATDALELQQITVPGKKSITAREFIMGYMMS